MDVSGCRLLTDQAFFPLLDGVVEEEDDLIPIILETLNVSGLDLLSPHTIHQLLTRLPRLQELSLGVTYDLDEADRILEIINHDQITFYIDIEKYYTICRMPNSNIIINPALITSNTITTNFIESDDNAISLPSSSTWALPPSIFQLE